MQVCQNLQSICTGEKNSNDFKANRFTFRKVMKVDQEEVKRILMEALGIRMSGIQIINSFANLFYS